MSDLERDTIHGAEQPLRQGETVQARFAADPAVYLRNHLIMIVVFGALAGVVLLATGNPNPWVGPVAALLAIGVRAAYVRSEAMAAEWRLTDKRLLGPGGRALPLGDIEVARKFFGDVQIVTRNGDKHLMKYMGDAPAVIASILTARNRR